MNPTADSAAKADDTRSNRVAEVIKNTDYIGKKYAAGTPNNSTESTASGSVEMAGYMLAHYDTSKAAAAV